MTELTESEIAKYILADILPNCGECIHYAGVHVFKDHYSYHCKICNEYVEFFAKACSKFKPNI